MSIMHACDVYGVCTVGGGLDKIVVLMEGESLFNDATSIVLFEIFFEMVKKLGDGGPGTEGGLLQEGLNIVVQISWLAAGMCSMLNGSQLGLQSGPLATGDLKEEIHNNTLIGTCMEEIIR